jgi:hypothetical protein
MKIYRLFSVLLAIIVIACLFAVQGQFQEQYVTPSSGYSTTGLSATQNPSQYSQFYIMTPGTAPGNPVGAPQQFEIAGDIPSTIYFGEQMQRLAYSQYQSYPAFTGSNSLWIKGATAWTQYVVVPQGATISLFAISPSGGGSGSLTFVDSDGQTYNHNYFFYPNSLFTFYADTIGRHMLFVVINGQTSNQVVIDVVSTYTQPGNYLRYYPWYYPMYNPWDHPRDHCKAGYHLENGHCVPNPVSCNASSHLENGHCVPNPVSCNASSHLENGHCVPNPVSCNASSHLENGTCVPDHTDGITSVDKISENTGQGNKSRNLGQNNNGGIGGLNNTPINPLINTTVNTPVPVNPSFNNPGGNPPINTTVNTPEIVNPPVNTPAPVNTPEIVNPPVNTPAPVNTPEIVNPPVNTPAPVNTPINPTDDNNLDGNYTEGGIGQN